MSCADLLFKKNCLDIIESGIANEFDTGRPHWEDGTLATTMKKFGVVNRYDLRQEFPILTLRPVPVRKAVDEMLWIWQQNSNNVNDLDSHVWDAWADENGSIGKAYGYQLGLRHRYPEGMFTQVEKLLYDLKNNPTSRRMIVNMYNHADLYEMALAPCAYSMTFNVTTPRHGRPVLNAILNQRSQDMVVANGWNTTQYAVLLMMIAQCVDMIPGEFIHVIADAHIYDRHIAIANELLNRETFPAPRVFLNPRVKDFWQFTAEDVFVEHYQHGPQIKNIPVAI